MNKHRDACFDDERCFLVHYFCHDGTHLETTVVLEGNGKEDSWELSACEVDRDYARTARSLAEYAAIVTAKKMLVLRFGPDWRDALVYRAVIIARKQTQFADFNVVEQD